MREALFALLVLAGPAIAQDDMMDGPVDGRWALQRIGDAPFAARAELDLSQAGRVSGSGPCNGFSGRVEGDWPKISVGPLRSTRRACPELGQEHLFFMALQSVQHGAMREDDLVLTDPAGRELVFIRLPAPSDE
ncbi:META domain-containing protein [Antarctobacter heliothermus]|uniref:Heat shock protein HslJ n=1 Tax=Antarctobacter heliothermus TaxID=74033 RepID=A0A239F5L4_9RHOB|nr:META domain-containing protein [Antarctobacter heliothermus]SNS51788.1 Heat shock protein HslJ [Antarctobacter heliothermus]